MKCVAKTVSGAIAEIDVEPTDTLAELKVRFLVLRSTCAFSPCAISTSPTRLDLPLRQGERRGLGHKGAGVRWFAQAWQLDLPLRQGERLGLAHKELVCGGLRNGSYCKSVDGFLCEECADIFFLLLLSGWVETVQAKIEAKLESGGAPVSKVIHKGKVLEEGKPVSDYGVADADMFVVMVNKAKPKAATEPTVDAATKPVAPTAPAQAPAAASAAPAPTSAAVPAGGGSQSYESSAATMVLGEEVEATVMQIMEMGFEREQVMKAMRAAFMNPDRAVEYLMSGIPEQSQRPQGAPGQHDGQDSEDGRAVDPALMAALQQQMLGGQVLVLFGYPLFPFAVPFLALN